ncbi:putative receptor protein kinase ZmPK1 [Hordeum vulgare]|nr:putative receptor protein kinase ZmPK1 [Hordeum vulgare]
MATLPYLILILIPSLLPITCASAQLTTLSAGSTLAVEEYEHTFLVSPNATFSCGFYPAGSNAFTFSVWFAGAADSAVVWSANRHSPVNGHGSKAMLHDDGYLVLADANGSTVWASSGGAGDRPTAALLETGNLVIRDSGGAVLWQSFATPTDTLLPCQQLTKDTRLVAGYHSLYFDNDNRLRLVYNGPEFSSIYWPNDDYTMFQDDAPRFNNNSRLAVLDDKGWFFSTDGLTVQSCDHGALLIRRRLTLEHDGNLRMRSLDASSGRWVVTWQAILQMHYVHGLCGKNGFFEYSPRPRCSCPPGFEMVNPNMWSKGCRPTFSYNCGQDRYRFIQIPQTDYYDFDLGFNDSISFEDCRNICLGMCSCIAFSYRLTGTGVCYPKGLLFNGYKSPAFPGSVYLKVPFTADIQASGSEQSALTCPHGGPKITHESSDHVDRWLYFYLCPGLLGALELILIVTTWWFLSKNGMQDSTRGGYAVLRSQFRRFTYQELQQATGKFREEVGRGGSGIVYRGLLKDKRVIAVKNLIDITKHEEEFRAEMSVIGRINHMNLVRTWGFCSEAKRKLLVYEFVENESLDRYLFNSTNADRLLAWSERFRIALGSARALAYLHHECLEWVLHCDVKPENILLTRDFEAKIADFGLAKLYKRDGSSFNFSHMRGTDGYMAPEWAMNLPINAKVDVYSYGVVLLELVAGRRISSCTRDGKVIKLKAFVQDVKGALATGDATRIVDAKLHGQFNTDQAVVMITTAVSCLAEERSRRPSMNEVVKSLLHCQE